MMADGGSHDAESAAMDDASGSDETMRLTRVSMGIDGLGGNGPSYGATISADGSIVVFVSEATNLTSPQVTGWNVFARDMASGTTEHLAPGHGVAAVSADGRWVAFNGYGDAGWGLYVYDRVDRTQELASVTTTGGGVEVDEPRLSADGRFVAFDSVAADLVPSDTNGVTDIFVRDRTAGTTERISLVEGETQASGASVGASLSADGESVAFTSGASLLAGDTGVNAYLYDRSSGLQRVSVSATGGQPNGESGDASLSADGRFVAFASWASDIVPGVGDDYTYNIFVWDHTTGGTSAVTVTDDGVQPNKDSSYPSISADGELIAFGSRATNLVPGDGGEFADVFLRNRPTGALEKLSVGLSGDLANDASYYVHLSADGRFAVFTSLASNLVDGDENGASDVFVVGPLR
jgi:Tol biopolymer transport system component